MKKILFFKELDQAIREVKKIVLTVQKIKKEVERNLFLNKYER